MQTSREWLVKQGLAKPTRGKLSMAALDALKKALAEGMEFSDRNADGTRKPVEKAEEPKRRGRKPKLVKEITDEGVVERPRISQQTAPAIKPAEIVREQTEIWGVCLPTAPGHKALAMVFSTCYACSKPVKNCKHEVPLLPRWLNRNVDGIGANEPGQWEKPTQEELDKLTKDFANTVKAV